MTQLNSKIPKIFTLLPTGYVWLYPSQVLKKGGVPVPEVGDFKGLEKRRKEKEERGNEIYHRSTK